MIYILVGNDATNRNIYIKELTKNRDVVLVDSSILTKESILNYSVSQSLFGESPIIVIDGLLKEKNIDLSPKDLSLLKDSNTVFILKEEKMLSSVQNKYKKYSEIKVFDEKKASEINQKFNIFSIADAFANKDKINTWILYNNAIQSGIEPEAISGVLFWKIKSLILNGSKSFDKDELKKQSSYIISLYHKAHRGEIDFTVGLEQFVLFSLSSR